jgi:Sulfotransferase family
VIVSHRHRFVFLKTRKTAGTSVEISLSRYCGPDDVITPIVPEDEAMRAELGLGPQNYARAIPIHRWRRRQLVQLARGQRPSGGFRNHTTAREAIALLGQETWDSYSTFCFTRNPWDRAASEYFWRRHRKGKKHLTVDQLLKRWDPAQNWEQYTIDGEVAVDVVGKFESLESDLRSCLETVGIEFDGWLAKAKANTGRRGTSYRELLEPRHVELIRERCRREIELFGYEF